MCAGHTNNDNGAYIYNDYHLLAIALMYYFIILLKQSGE